MNYKGNNQPPYWMLAFFRWFCRPDYREDIEGDLLERFHNEIKNRGARKAKSLFIKDVLFLFRPGIIRGLRSRHNEKIIAMKKINWIKLTGLNLLVVLMIVSPFIPGPSNKLVGVFSFLGQLTGIFGLLLVPVGLSWIIIEIRKLQMPNGKKVSQKFHYRLAISATLLVALVFLGGVLFLPNPMPKISCLFGLLLVLSGLILALQQIRKWKDNNESIPGHGASIILAASATVCITFMYLFLSLCIFVLTGIIPGILALLLLPVGLTWAVKQIRKLKEPGETKFNRLPLYLVSVPLIAFFAFMFIMEPVSEFSRSFAIKRSESLIASIEDHKNRTGQYPESIQDMYLQSSQKIPKPFIMGISDFRYNKINDNYSLSFSQWLNLGSLEEIVLYDKTDIAKRRNALPPYDYKLDLHRVKGAFAIYNTGHSNWRSYHCD